MSLFNSLEDFCSEIGFDKNACRPTFEEWKEKATFWRKGEFVSSEKFIVACQEKLKEGEDDLRATDPEKFFKAMYKMFVINADKYVEAFFNQFKFDENSKTELIKFTYGKECLEGDTFDGKLNSKTGRVIKNIFYKYIYGTPKYDGEAHTMIEVFVNSVINYKYFTNLITPSVVSVYERDDISTVLAVLRGTGGKISVFNPYTALGVIKYIQSKDNSVTKMLTPVLDWNSYLLAFLNSNLDEYVGIDVIEDVVEKGRLLADLPIFKQKKGGLRKKKNDKKVTLYKCPTEKLDEKHDFSNIYNEHFDFSFCSPPYFNLEFYENGEGDQAINSFSNYDEWLIGYWEETVKTVYNTIRKGGYFTFVISNYTDAKTGKYVTISEDMKAIVEKYFKFEETKHILWNGFVSLTEKAGEAGGIKENLHIFKKE